MARDIWEGALRSAKKIEQRFGRRHLGLYSDVDRSLMNRKLSGLRWFLSEAWDGLHACMIPALQAA